MTDQELFNRVYQHLTTMPAQAKVNSLDCSYDKSHNGGCAVGVLFPDGHDVANFMGDAEEALCQYPDLQEHLALEDLHPKEDGFGLEGRSLTLLMAFQGVHDDDFNWDENGLLSSAREELADIAKEFGLEVPQ